MMRMFMSILAVGLFLAPLGCAQTTNQVANAVGTFGLKFFSQVQEGAPKNYVFSPYSISAAFASILPVTSGETRSEIQSTLGLDTLISQEMVIFNARHLSPEGKVASLANGWFVQKGLRLSAPIRHNSALVQEVDFASNPEGARRKINKFVSKATRDLIKEVFPPGSVTRNTQLALANSLYFESEWQNHFKSELTKTGDFHGLGGKKEKATLMTVQHLKLDFKEIPELEAKAIAFPYDGGAYHMLIIVPDQPDGLQALIDHSSDPMGFSTFVEGYTRTPFSNVVLPKFSIQTSIDALQKPLSKMGLESIFRTDSADLRIVEGGGLALDEAVHKALIEVDEIGTRATAATGFGLIPLSARIDGGDFVVDRPFMYLLANRDGNTVLFMGTVVSPGVKA
ncbi:hypothetical protein BSKO_07399 [Bryopsis sp. KO-2023]|nr:hypothetical protein BSKO_07399 [Bryopsis sp. KO-2023]